MGVGDGVTVQAVRQRGARQERLHEGPAALPLQGLRSQLHRHPAARDAAPDQGHGRAPLPERAVDEPHRQAPGRVHAQRDDLDRAVRQSLRANARAGRPRLGDRTRRDVALSKKKSNKLWVWKARDRATGRVVDWECGGRDAATLSRLLERVERWNPRLYCTDDWAAYSELIPQGRLFVGKEETHGIERDHSRQRHWLARFRRRTCVVSKAVRMVEASIALFVRFGDADGIGELLSMLA
jgi:insertion element IS1 protein InsB